MAKTQIDVPASFSFSTELPVLITDLNYGGHVGNDRILSFAHEARMRFLQSKGYTELNVGGAGLIMRDAVIQFKKEIFYGDHLRISMAVADITRTGFDLIYQIEKTGTDPVTAALVRTGILCFDYATHKVVAIPDIFLTALRSSIGRGESAPSGLGIP